MVSLAEERMNMMSNSMYESRVSEVVDIERQLVNGFNYKVSLASYFVTLNNQHLVPNITPSATLYSR